jgi:proteic killer suppression protein
MPLITEVRIAKLARRQLEEVPEPIRRKFALWYESVRRDGLEATRRVPGFHDEPLKGKRAGQRSIRLNRSYRAIYVIGRDGAIEFVSVEEVNKHDY